MRWVTLVLVGGLVSVCGAPAVAVDGAQTFEFSYNPDEELADGQFYILDGHVRKGRSSIQNWSGSNSVQVFDRTSGSTRSGIMQFHNLLSNLPTGDGLKVGSAVLNMHLRNSMPKVGEGDPPAQTFDVHPMALDVMVGNGDGQIPPASIAENLCSTPGCGSGWMSWENKQNDVLDEVGGPVPWGNADNPGTDGPVEGVDFLSSPKIELSVTPAVWGLAPGTDGGDDAKRYGQDLDITPIVQAWYNGDIDNHGIIMIGHEGIGGLYFMGADTVASGAAGALKSHRPRYMPKLTVTLVPEPATLGLLCLGGLVALRRNRR